MVNLNKHKKTKSEPKPTCKFNNCSQVVHIIVDNCRTRHSTEQFSLFFLLTSSKQSSQLWCCPFSASILRLYEFVVYCWSAGGQFSYTCHLRDGHCSQLQSGHVHVKHAVRMQHSLQDETTFYHRHEQGQIDFVFCFAVCCSLLRLRQTCHSSPLSWVNSSLKCSVMAHINEGSHSFTCHPHV